MTIWQSAIDAISDAKSVDELTVIANKTKRAFGLLNKICFKELNADECLEAEKIDSFMDDR